MSEGTPAPGGKSFAEVFDRRVQEVETEWEEVARPMLEGLGFFDVDLAED